MDVDVKKGNGCWCQELSESVRNYPDANMATVPRALNAGNSF